MVGAKVSTNYVFEGLKEGKTEIIFKFIRIDDNSIESKEVTKVLVDEKNNISIV